jgi:hypothetical protein
LAGGRIFVTSIVDSQSRSPSLRSLGRKRRLWDNPNQSSESDIQKTVCRPNCACVGKSKTNCLKYFIVSSIKWWFFRVQKPRGDSIKLLLYFTFLCFIFYIFVFYILHFCVLYFTFLCFIFCIFVFYILYFCVLYFVLFLCNVLRRVIIGI